MKIRSWILVLLFASAGILGTVSGLYYIDNIKPNFDDDYVFYVRPETKMREVMDSLVHGAGALHPKSIERAFRKEEVDGAMKPGKYVVNSSSTSAYVARMVKFGWQTPQKMTISGTIRSKGKLAKKISTQMMADSASIAAALDSAEFLSQYGFTPETVFAMVLPDTYEMYWTASVKEIFDRLKKEYDAFWNPDRLAKARKQGLSQLEVSVVASIVSGETLKAFEYPLIAGVYLNRYKKGMKLQADPTVCFCYDYTLDRVLKKHLTIDSPYNTYKYAGLPPAPINVPPKSCLDAVLNPDKHGYIYFCASPAFDGTHRFAVTYKEHLKNAKAFQRELTARRKAKASASSR